MPELIILINNTPSLPLPAGIVGWFGWLFILGIIVFMQKSWWNLNQPLVKWRLRALIILVLLVPITSVIVPAVELEPSVSPPLFMLPIESTGTPLTLFAAIPWMLAAGFIGPVSAAGLAALSGLFIAIWGTQNPFLPLELAALASIFGWMMQQGYRTLFFRFLRHPLFASLLISVISPALLIVDALLIAQGNLVSRIDFGLSHIEIQMLAFITSLLIAGVISQAIALIAAQSWGNQQPSIPSPAEKRLTGRFLFIIIPISLFLLAVLIVSDWVLAGRAARTMLEGRMESAAKMTVGSIPTLMQTGEELIRELVRDSRYYEMTPEEIQEALSKDIGKVAYFTQLIFVDPEGQVVASQPVDVTDRLPLSQVELRALRDADLIPVQSYPIRPQRGGGAAIISFIAGVLDENNSFRGALIGRSDLAENPFAKSLIAGLQALSNIQGDGIMIDEDKMILYHPISSHVMTPYGGRLDSSINYYSEPSFDGSLLWVYYLPAAGKSWGVVFTVPNQFVQEQSISIAVPLLGTIVVLSLIAVFMIRYGLKTVTASLQQLTVEADRMAHGELNRPMNVKGEDEVGQLGWAFEQMRLGLKSRLDELNRLLHVSQGVASTLELAKSLTPVLESALLNGATASRVAIQPSVLPNLDGVQPVNLNFGYGPAAEHYAFLDEQVLALTQRQEVVKLTSLTRPRLLTLPKNTHHPQSLLAIALRHENLFFGSLWIAHDQPHQFTEDEVRYLITLAGQAALAVANARLFLTAEIGRLRLESILKSTPDPVLVTDQDDRLLLTNPAARRTFELNLVASIGKPIEDVMTNRALVELLKSEADEQQTEEIPFPSGTVYLATASTMFSDETRLGRVCVLRDVTSFKKLDAMKSEFVSTVSHDLRSPLTLIQGYASMLPIVGELNDQQNNYLGKINEETGKITRLVNSVLNLGRIESGLGLQLESKPIPEVIDRAIGSLQARASQKRIQLVNESRMADLPELEADQDLIHQALYNLIENAIKYSESDSKVILNAHTNQGLVTVSVQDRGIGISPTDKLRLFEKFYRSTRKGDQFDGGTGLGLSIVKSIADRHGGQVWVDSQLGKGSTFYFAIPLQQPEQ